MKLQYLVIVLLCLPLPSISQNLVLNPSFEDTKACAQELGHFRYRLHNWSAPTQGTSDLFNPCAEGETGAPKNFMGEQEAEEGSNYAGIFLYVSGNYREYIQGQLTSTLEKGKKYKVSVYISLAENSDHAIRSFGFLFTDRSFRANQKTTITERWLKNSRLKNYQLHEVEHKKHFANREQWMLVTTEFIAEGYEQYITLGNFRNNLQTDAKFLEMKKDPDLSYYYVDRLSVEEVREPSNLLTENSNDLPTDDVREIQIPEIELDKNFVFQNVHFDFDSSDLKEAAKEEIESVFQFLKNNQKTEIIINGHTDDVGSKDFNQVLSENRAKAVAGYFEELGLSKNRIKTFGFGNSQPLTSNDSDEGRSTNRRVEFIIKAQKNAYN